MDYQELVTRALQGRSVNAAAKAWGIPQPTLRKYTNGQRIPNFRTALIMAKEAGITEADAMRTLAAEEEKMKSKTEKISESFNSLLRGAKRYWARVPATA